jgi:hypothetical protein
MVLSLARRPPSELILCASIHFDLDQTLAGIINGNSLVRGLLGLTVLFAFQRVT